MSNFAPLKHGLEMMLKYMPGRNSGSGHHGSTGPAVEAGAQLLEQLCALPAPQKQELIVALFNSSHPFTKVGQLHDMAATLPLPQMRLLCNRVDNSAIDKEQQQAFEHMVQHAAEG